MSQLEQQLESIPGYGLAMDKFNDYAGEKFNNTNPFEDEEGNKRVLTSTNNSEKEKRVWKQIQKSAWVHDKCFLGSCGVGMDCGIGLIPLAVFFLPGIGAIVTYVIHARIISMAQNELYLPTKFVAKLQSNILLDFLISLPPFIGAFLSWLNGCSTRNAGMIYVYLSKEAEKRATGRAPVYVGPVGRQNRGIQGDQMGGYNGKIVGESRGKKVKEYKGKKVGANVVIGQQQSGIR